MSIIKKVVNWARIKSPWVLHFNTGACNACDIEIVASLTPRFDLERFGVVLKGTPRHADVLLCSGPVTRQIKCRLQRIYEQMPEPKFVVAVGTCACSGDGRGSTCSFPAPLPIASRRSTTSSANPHPSPIPPGPIRGTRSPASACSRTSRTAAPR